jgi:hypothetical protein
MREEGLGWRCSLAEDEEAGLPDFSLYDVPKRKKNGHKIYHTPKFTRIRLFGLKICTPSGNTAKK